MKHPFFIAGLIFLQLTSLLTPVYTLGNQCNIKYCSSCDPKTNFCYQCDLPYKPGYANQTICTRCANNCAVCETAGTDSKGRCLSCQPNFNYSSDDHCDTFYIWIYIVTIASYVVFIILLFIIFCYMKRRKERNQAMWFQNLKKMYNKVDTNTLSTANFHNMCDELMQLLKQSSNYNNLKFKDREYQKAMKIKQITMRDIPKESHIKKIKIIGSDNSEFTARGYVFAQHNTNGGLKMWLAKDYKRKVFSESISKVIIYESERIQRNEIRGRWHYYGAEEIGGSWIGVRQQIQMENMQNVNEAGRVIFS